MTPTLERINYHGWPNAYRLSNGVVEVVATADVGPRLVRFGFVGGPNEFAQFAETLGQTGGSEWRLYGGHRLWHAPEHPTLTYTPDNDPVAVTPLEGGARLTQPVVADTGIEKEIEIHMQPGQAGLRVTHRLRNRGAQPVALAPWALSVMDVGGTAVVPLPPRGPHPEFLAPTSVLVLWPYTDLSDPRWIWGRRYVLLRQDPAARAPQKIGALAPDGWLAYARGGHLFVKTFTPVPGAAYPDLGCSVQIFTNHEMLELETLGPVTTLAPGAAVEHVEHWHLFDGVRTPANDDDVEAEVAPRVREALGRAGQA